MARFNHDLLLHTRLDLGLSQEEVARAVKVDVRTYRRYESGAVNEGGVFEVRNASRKKLLARLCKELGVADVDAWLVPEVRSKVVRSRHALQRAPHFVGREKVLARIARFAAEDRVGVLLVRGVGGAGKTSLVERVVAVHAPKAWVHGFYDDVRTEAVVEELARDRGPLVVLDGIETVQSEGGNGRAFGELEDPALRHALRAICAGTISRKVLVTSRLPLSDFEPWKDDGFTTLDLAPLGQKETMSLLRAWGIEGNDAALAPLFARTGGHALSVAMLGSYIATFLDGDPKRAPKIPRDAADDDPIARRLSTVLQSYADSLAPHERDVLARLSLFAGAADIDLLSLLANAPDRTRLADTTVLRTVTRLARLGLVTRTPLGVVAHPFVREHFKRLLGEGEAPSITAHARIRDALAHALEGKPTVNVRDAELLDRYEALFQHTLRSGRADEALGIYTHSMGGFGNLGLRIGAMARGARVLASFSSTGAPADVDKALTPERRAMILYEWGLYAGALGDLAFAARCHDEHLLTLDDRASSARAMGLRTRAYVAWLAGDLALARMLLERSRLAAQSTIDARSGRFHVVRASALLAMVEHDAGDPIATTRALDAAHALEPVPTARRALWEAEIAIASGEVERAKDLATGALNDCARRGWIGHVAHAETVLGLAVAARDPSLSRVHLERALPWVHAAHEVEMALRCHHLAARIAKDARREAERGLALARTHGFVGFERLFTRLSDD